MSVYSKEKGFTDPPVGAGGLRRPHRTPRVSVPPNYRGHAIVDGEERPLGQGGEIPPPYAPEALSPADIPGPRFDGLPRVRQMGEEPRCRPRGYGETYEGRISSPDGTDTAPAQKNEGDVPPDRDLPLPLASSSDRPQGFLSLGSEELLLLGLILLLLREGGDCDDRGDLDETVVLLGLLLLLG